MDKPKAAFVPIKNHRTFEQVSSQIKKMIIDGVYTSGDKLPPEAELASLFGVGRQSVREALRILELSGFVTIHKGGGGGAIVQDSISSTISNLFLDAFQLEKTSLEELTIARVEIEKVVLKHAVMNADENDIRALRDNIRIAQKKNEENRLIISDNIQFHQILAQASKNNLFVIVVKAITTAVRHCMSQLGTISSQMKQDDEHWVSERNVQSRKTLAYHEAIITAIEQRNVQKATDILEAHLMEVRDRLVLMIQKQN